MKLSDVMSAMQLAGYAEIGLLLFLGAFIAVVIEVLRRGPALERLAEIPLEPEDLAARRDERASR